MVVLFMIKIRTFPFCLLLSCCPELSDGFWTFAYRGGDSITLRIILQIIFVLIPSIIRVVAYTLVALCLPGEEPPLYRSIWTPLTPSYTKTSIIILICWNLNLLIQVDFVTKCILNSLLHCPHFQCTRNQYLDWPNVVHDERGALRHGNGRLYNVQIRDCSN